MTTSTNQPIGDFLNYTVLVESKLSSAENEVSWKTILASCFVVVMVILGMVGNAVIIISIFRDKRLHTRGNFLIGSLAVTDFLVSMLVCPFFAWMTLDDQWYFNMKNSNHDPDVACKIFAVVDVACCTASILHLCAIAHDRYRAVTDLQYRAKCSFKRLSICVTSMWLAAIFLSVTPLILERIIDFYGSQNSTNKMNNTEILTTNSLEDNNKEPTNFCEVTNEQKSSTTHVLQIYRVIATTIAFYAPLVFIIVIYARVATIAWSRIHTVVTSPVDAAETSKRLLVLVNRRPSKFFSLKYFCFGKNEQNNELKGKLKCCGDDTSSSVTSSIIKNKKDFVEKSKNNFLTVEYSRKLNDVVVEDDDGNRNQCFEAEISSNNEAEVSLKTRTEVGTHFPRLTNDFLATAKTACASATGRDVSSRSRIMLRREKKLIKTMGLVIGAFVICWLPFFVKELIQPFYEINLQRNVENLIDWLGYFNSALNPLIYAFTNQDISRAILSTLKRITPRIFLQA